MLLMLAYLHVANIRPHGMLGEYGKTEPLLRSFFPQQTDHYQDVDAIIIHTRINKTIFGPDKSVIQYSSYLFKE